MKDLKLCNWEVLTNLVFIENLKQLQKWGIQDHDPFIWLSIIVEEVGELSKAILEGKMMKKDLSEEITKEAIQVATLALKIAEMHIFKNES